MKERGQRGFWGGEEEKPYWLMEVFCRRGSESRGLMLIKLNLFLTKKTHVRSLNEVVTSIEILNENRKRPGNIQEMMR